MQKASRSFYKNSFSKHFAKQVFTTFKPYKFLKHYGNGGLACYQRNSLRAQMPLIKMPDRKTLKKRIDFIDMHHEFIETVDLSSYLADQELSSTQLKKIISKAYYDLYAALGEKIADDFSQEARENIFELIKDKKPDLYEILVYDFPKLLEHLPRKTLHEYGELTRDES